MTIVIGGDVAWVVGTAGLALLAKSQFTSGGLVVLLVVGAVVADLAIVQTEGWRRLGDVRDAGSAG